jgi:uncharacterized membrane protein YdbT with pleckstrin-like domain
MHKLFASQLEDEIIYLVVRRHWFFLAKRVFLVLLFAILYVIAVNKGPAVAPGFFEGTLGSVTMLFFRLYLLGLLFTLFIIWVLYYTNMQVVTNIRIVDVDQISLFARTVSELNITNVQDVTSESHGLFATIFGYGTVHVQTAGVQSRFEFEQVPYPEEIKKLLLDLYEKEVTKIKPFTEQDPAQAPIQR